MKVDVMMNMTIVLYLQPSVGLRFINPQPCSGYFQFDVPIFDADVASKISARVLRSIRGAKGMNLYYANYTMFVKCIAKLDKYKSMIIFIAELVQINDNIHSRASSCQ